MVSPPQIFPARSEKHYRRSPFPVRGGKRDEQNNGTLERQCWKLMTDLPVASRQDAPEKIQWYALRWTLETFHKILKSRCQAEEAKLRAAERLGLVGFGAHSPLLAQTTIATGSIVGTVGDPSGAIISGATVRITNGATGQAINMTSNSSGTFNSGPLIPGNYTTRFTAERFRSPVVSATVLVGNTTTVKRYLAGRLRQDDD